MSVPDEPAKKRPPQTDTVSAELYALYPRHVGRAAAIKAIEKARSLVARRNGVPDPDAWLKERVMMFATSAAGKAGRFTPHPATWFGQARFDDDESEWARERDTTEAGSKPAAKRRLRGAGEYAEKNLVL